MREEGGEWREERGSLKFKVEGGWWRDGHTDYTEDTDFLWSPTAPLELCSLSSSVATERMIKQKLYIKLKRSGFFQMMCLLLFEELLRASS